ncbi:MAG: DNA/RNA non-specific endonuclease [Bacteroidia bacterium]
MKKFLIIAGLLLVAFGIWYINSQSVQPIQLPKPDAVDDLPVEAEKQVEKIDEPIVLSEALVLPKTNADDVIIKRLAYTLSFNEKHEQAEWVAYTLSQSEVKGGAKRKDNFKADPDIETESAQLNDYKKSGYDRGHLAPAADMSKNQKIMDESFYMSNMSPQEPSFNRGIWKKLEEQVRNWTMTDTLLYVVTGPVLTDGLPTIGENGVSIPEYYYKIIADFSEPELKCIAFLMPNKKLKDPIYNFVVSIDSLEQVTGLDFYHLLPNNIEDSLEQTKDWIVWQ